MPNQSFGTAGFAAPELWDDAHAADGRADIYSLGRVVAWATTGQWPKPNIPLIPKGSWQEFVAKTTTLDVGERVQDLNGVLQLLPQGPERTITHSMQDSLITFPVFLEVNKHQAVVEQLTQVMVALHDVTLSRKASFTIKLPKAEPPN